VRRLEIDKRDRHRVGLLGLSRDVQPFALVVIEANEEHVLELTGMVGAERSTPRCGRTFEETGDAILARCGARLAEMVAHADFSSAISAKVERHELQHQIDGPLLPMATPVMKKLAGYADHAQARVNRELSAYLAQLTANTSPLHVGLIIPLRFCLLEDRGTYHHAAVLMFEALGQRSVRSGRRVDPALLAPVFDDLLALDETALSERASEAWEDLFGDDLPRVHVQAD
jgi:hypothetical protein